MNGAARRALAAVRDFTVAQRTIAIIGVAVLVLGGIALATVLGKPTMSPLFTGLSGTDASAIVAQLEKDKVQYTLDDGGATILVPVDEVDAERLAAASAGLPSASTSGYALLDSMGVTASEFQQNVTYQRAVEGEIAKTIESIHGVRTASVHLALPKESVFTSTKQDATASVFVDALQPLSSDQVQSIVHLTASAVSGLKEENVSVVDAKGETLSSSDGGAGGTVAEQTNAYETATRGKVQAMLDQMVGPGNSSVTVAADISASTGEKTSESYSTPSNAPVISESNDDSKYSGAGGAAASGVMGADSAGGTTGTGGTGSYTQTKGVKNNAVNKTIERRTITAGTLTRQSIAVAVDVSKLAGTSTATLQGLVAAAAGVNATRGDTVTVSATPFSTAAAASAKAALAQSKADQASEQQMELIMLAVKVFGALAGLVILLVVLRKLFRKPEQQEPADAGALNLLPGGGADGSGAATERLGLTDGGLGHPGGPTAVLPSAGRQALPAAADDDSPFGRLQADVDALAGADPERTADYLRALMADRVEA